MVTGANTGIGYETAVDLAERGARVLMACRDMTRAEKAKAKVSFIYDLYHGLLKLVLI